MPFLLVPLDKAVLEGSALLPVVTADIVFLKEDPEFLFAGEVTVSFLDAHNDLGGMPVPVVVVGIAYEKIKIEVD